MIISTMNILIASPSRTERAKAASLISGLAGCSVVALAGDLSETFNHAEILVPDIVVIAEDFTRIEEFSVMKTLFSALGTGWVILLPEGQAPLPEGVAAGSAASAGRPALDLSQPADHWRRILRTYRGAPRLSNAAPNLAGLTGAATRSFDKIVVIGASTGGVDALLTMLAAFPADCPATAIVQHTGRGFGDSLVQLLRRRCKPEVVVPQDGMTLQAGRIHLAAGTDGHLELEAGPPPRCRIRAGAPISGHAPSIDALFRSALTVAPGVVGVILTGMGQDGAGGLLDLNRAGAVTIGQDEETSVVYGMPRVAWERGAVQIQLPIQRIGEEILRQAQPRPAHDRRFATR